MDIGPLIKDVNKIMAFIKKDLVLIEQPSKNALFNDDHPLTMYNFNYQAKKGESYTLYNFPIEEMYAYSISNKEVTLYACMSFKQVIINSLVEQFGMANNVTSEDLVRGDFDFLLWKMKDRFEIIITPIHGRSNLNMLVIFTNMDYTNKVFNYTKM